MKTIQFIAFAMLLLVACKKQEPASPPASANNSGPCEDIQNVKHFFYFKPGSWWIYEEENSGELDTVKVTFAAHDPNNYYFDVEVYSTYQDYYYHYWPVSSQTSPSAYCPDDGIICNRCIKVKRSKYKPGDFVGEGTCFLFLPILGELDYVPNVYYANNKITINSIYDSLTIGNLDFERTIRVNELNTRIEGVQPTNHYFAEDVGLIRKELLDSNHVWNLIDYYIQE